MTAPTDPKLSVPELLAGVAAQWPEAAARAQPAVLWLYRVRDQLYDDLAGVLEPFGLRPPELDILVALRAQPRPRQLTPTVLYRTLLLSSGGLTKILHRLEKAGLVTRPSNPADRRSRLVRLTGLGEALVEEVLDAVIQHQQRFLAPLSAGERAELTRLLEKLAR